MLCVSYRVVRGMDAVYEKGGGGEGGGGFVRRACANHAELSRRHMSVLSLIVSTNVVRHELIFGLAGAAVSAIGIIYGSVALCGGLNSKYLSCSRASLQ
jgi:hypothetical protein